MSGPGLKVSRGDPRLPALRRLRPPAFLLLCLALLDILFWVGTVVLMALNIQLIPPPPGVDPATVQRPEFWQLSFTVLGAVVSRALSIWSAMNAFNLRNWGLTVVGSVTIMFPLAPACCPGVLVGAWMLFTLNAPEVRQHFT